MVQIGWVKLGYGKTRIVCGLIHSTVVAMNKQSRIYKHTYHSCLSKAGLDVILKYLFVIKFSKVNSNLYEASHFIFFQTTSA